jgi:methionyl-tRNA formyltransferase
MAQTLSIAIASYGRDQFELLNQVVRHAGHRPVAYVLSRSMRPAQPAEPEFVHTIAEIVGSLPDGMDLLLPGTADGLADTLTGYRLDLLIVYGFNWKLPAAVLNLPRHGVLNIHTSLLPKYRGPAPVLWAIRNGDPGIGLTIHRMDEDLDTGPIITQQGGIPLDDDVTPQTLWPRLRPVLAEQLTAALDHVVRGHPTTPQQDTDASNAGFIEPEFSTVDWSRPAREVHNQVRMFAFMGREHAPLAQVGDETLKVYRTRLEPSPGIRVECADAPIWIVESEPANPQ